MGSKFELPNFSLGLGLAALGRPGYINLGHAEDLGADYDTSSMQARTHQVLDAAFALGVRYFDAARSYGKAEAFLGRWLKARNIDPKLVTVGSKWGYRYTADWRVDADKHEIKEHTLAHLLSQHPESVETLGDWLSLYQIHSATLQSGVLKDSEILNALSKLKQQGLAIGFSTSGPEQAQTIDLALEAKVDGVRVFDTVQSTWNLLEQSAGEALGRAKSAGLGIIIKEAVANGRLTDRNRGLPSALRSMVETHNTTVDAFAIAAAIAMPFVDVVLSGAATKAHLASNHRAMTLKLEDTETLARLTESPSVYWSKRGQLAWN